MGETPRHKRCEIIDHVELLAHADGHPLFAKFAGSSTAVFAENPSGTLLAGGGHPAPADVWRRRTETVEID